MEESNFTPNSWKEFKKAFDAAKAVADNKDATQTEVNEKLAALNAAKEDVYKRQAMEEIQKNF